jgi:hypothetical protein
MMSRLDSWRNTDLMLDINPLRMLIKDLDGRAAALRGYL